MLGVIGRTCKVCGLSKTVPELVPAATCRYGVRSLCKACNNARHRDSFVADDKHRARIAAWRAANPEKAKEHERSAHRRNSEKRNAYSRAYRKANLENMRERGRMWAKQNPARANEITADRRSAKLRATPAWSDDELNQLVMSEAYRLAKARTKTTGQVWHVDHIVPLRSDRVCGLHCAANIRVIPSSVNHSKGNRLWPDMPQRLEAIGA